MKHHLNDIWDYIRSHPKKIFLLVLVGVFLLWVFFGNFGVVARLRMEAENRALKETRDREERRILENTVEIRRARDPETVEKIAREKYNFRKDDETLFIIEEN
ncbi:septum formation initiator [Prosthecochloris sp. GSB1]|uniref:FtsB family cell division protein n=1 Tax=Prosthecochloris sp. GSB1 TaxID=281093 RepID=UPI000B8D00A8|nr:septum formation initiator family protein [Prosthecochloris sp. GSB1]ASQ89757.1 septum formation initiator [Prosthecochloris sp. GSB1]